MSSSRSFVHTGEGVVIDIGTGDGRFVLAAARANPDKFYIGIDANAKPLEKPSIKITRKPAKGGLANAMFVQAAIEDLPDELNETADEIHIHFPWGSLLKAVATADRSVLDALQRISAPECVLEIVFGVDPTRDRSEMDRLGVPEVTAAQIERLLPDYAAAGFTPLDHGILKPDQWRKLETSWSRKLQGNTHRVIAFMLFEKVESSDQATAALSSY